jgi:serine/threonine protein kinase
MMQTLSWLTLGALAARVDPLEVSNLGDTMLLEKSCDENATGSLADLGAATAVQWISKWRGRLAENPKVLGKGNYGTVYLAKTCEDFSVGVKVQRRQAVPNWERDMENEVNLMEEVGQSPLAQRFAQVYRDEWGYSPDRREFSYMVQFAGEGDLKGFQKYSRMNFDQYVLFFGELLEGLNVMHKMGMVHRDLKPDNLMVKCFNPSRLSAKGKVCHLLIGDMGLTCVSGRSLGVPHNRCESEELGGTPMYMAPEYNPTRPNKPQPSNDMWAAGLVMAEALKIGNRDAAFFHGNPMSMPALCRSINSFNIERKVTVRDVMDRFPNTMKDGREKEVATVVGVLYGLMALSPRERLSAPAALEVLAPVLKRVRESLGSLADFSASDAALPACWHGEPTVVEVPRRENARPRMHATAPAPHTGPRTAPGPMPMPKASKPPGVPAVEIPKANAEEADPTMFRDRPTKRDSVLEKVRANLGEDPHEDGEGLEESRPFWEEIQELKEAVAAIGKRADAGVEGRSL